MKNTILTIVYAYLAFDFLTFFMWAMSGQHPVDGFYIGAVTAKVVSLFINLIG